MIRNLIFDLGGVIMDIERQRSVEAYKALGMADIEEFLGEYKQLGVFGELEQGLVTPEQWRGEVRRHIAGEVSDEQIDAAFDRFLVGIPRRRLQALRELRSRYRLYLLSNTNTVMWHRGIDRAFRQEGLSVDDYFDGIVTSFEVKLMKPDPAIFRRLMADYGLVAEESIFLDDSLANCQSAAALGLGYIHVAPGKEFYDLIP